MNPDAVLDFWFSEDAKAQWWAPPPAFDDEIRRRFGALHETAAAEELEAWEATADGALALLIVLDQFPRNMFRDDARAFAADPLARAVAQRAIDRGHDLAVPADRRLFFYLPLEHSEDLVHQDRSCALFAERCDIGQYVEFAERHRTVIARFGRFPHRNAVLGRESTPEEKAYLESSDRPF